MVNIESEKIGVVFYLFFSEFTELSIVSLYYPSNSILVEATLAPNAVKK